MDCEWLSVLDDAGDVGRRHGNFGSLDCELQLPFDDVFPVTAHSRLRCLDAKHAADCDTCVGSAGRSDPRDPWLRPQVVDTRPHSTRAPTQVHASA